MLRVLPRSAKKKIGSQPGLFGLVLLLTWVAQIQTSVRAAVCDTYTSWIGPNTGTTIVDESQIDDESVRLTNIHYCLQGGQNFRAFSATWTGDSGAMTYSYGAVGYPGDDCQDRAIDTDIVSITVYYDSEDIEGFVLTDGDGHDYSCLADGVDAYSPVTFQGRPVGFKVDFGPGGTHSTSGDVLNTMPLQMQVVYNNCNCPATTYLEDAPPLDMSTPAGGNAATQTVDNQLDTISDSYGTDCGGYTLAIDPPDLPFLTLSGNTLTLLSDDVNDIGEYDITMTVVSDGYDQTVDGGATGQIPSIQYSFVASIDPCAIDAFIRQQYPSAISRTLGQAEATLGTHTFQQFPDCGYEVTVQVTGLDASLGLHNADTLDFTLLETNDHALAGTHTVTILAFIDVPDSASKSSYTRLEVEYDFEITVTDPCDSTSLYEEAPFQDMLLTWVYTEDETMVMPTVPDTASCDYVDQDCLTFCGERLYSFTVSPDTYPIDEFLTYNSATRQLVASSTNTDHADSYTVTVEVTLVEFPDIAAFSAEFALEIQVHACYVTTFLLPTTLSDMTATLGDVALTQAFPPVYDQASCDVDGVDCQTYCGDRTITLDSVVKNDPSYSDDTSFLTTVGSDIQLVVDNESFIGEYTATLQYSLVDYPEFPSVTETFIVTINECSVTTFEAVDPPTSVSYTLSLNSQEQTHSYLQTTDCGYDITLVATNLDSEIGVTDVTGSEPVTRYQSIDRSFVGTHTITLTATISVPDDFTQTTHTDMTVTYDYDLEVVDACETTVLSFTNTLSELEIFVHDAEGSSTLPSVEDVVSCELTPDDCSYCGAHTITYTIDPPIMSSDDPAKITTFDFDSATATFTGVSTNIDDAMDRTIEVTVTLDDYPSVTLTEVFTFRVRVNPCDLSVFLYPSNLAPMTVGVMAAAEVQVLPIVQDQVSCDDDPNDCLSYCGDRSITIKSVTKDAVDYPDFADFLTIVNNEMQIYSEEIGDMGVYEVTLDYSLIDWPTIVGEEAFAVTIAPCVIETFVAVDSPPATYDYTLSESDHLVYHSFRQTPECGYPIVYTLVGQEDTDVFSNNLSDGTNTEWTRYSTIDKSKVTTYPITLTATISEPVDVVSEPTTYEEHQVVQEYSVTILDPCEDTILAFLSGLSDFSVTIFEGEAQVVVPDVLDSVSCDITPSDCNTFCGTRVQTFSASPPLPSATEATLLAYDEDTRTFTSVSNDVDDFGVYTITVDVSLTDYPSRTLREEFTFTVDSHECWLTQFIIPSNLEDMNQTFLSSAVTQALPAVQDQSSCDNGNQDCVTQCGAREITISSVKEVATNLNIDLNTYTTFLTIDAVELTLDSTNLDDIGQYEVTLEYKLTEWDTQSNYASATTTTAFQLTAIETFILTIDPCVITDFTSSSPSIIVEYRLADPQVTTGEYSYVQTPNCGYTETETITGHDVSPLSLFPVIHNPWNQADSTPGDFTVEPSIDLATLGRHTVTVENVISVPADFNKVEAEYVDWTVSITVVFAIDPCIISTFVKHTFPTLIEYELGDPEFLQALEFTQTPACGYVETITITPSSPVYIYAQASDNDSHQFTIPLQTDKANVGLVTYTVLASVEEPTDHTQSSFTTIEETYTFDIEIKNACILTELSFDAELVDMEVFINEDAVTETLPLVSDTIGCEVTNGCHDYCGPRIYTITVDPTSPPSDEFLTYDDATRDLTAESSDLSHYNSYTVTVEVHLELHPEITISGTFDLSVTANPCWLSSLIVPTNLVDMSVPVHDPAEFQELPIVKDSASCVDDPDDCVSLCGERIYTVESVIGEDGVDYQEFFQFDPANGMNLESADVAHIGQYTVTLGYALADYDVITETEEFTLTITPCIITSVDPDWFGLSELTEIEYTLSDSPKTWIHGFTQTPACGYEFSVTISGISTDIATVSSNADLKITNYDSIDKQFVGTTAITLVATVLQPTDYTKTYYIDWATSYNYDLVVLDPCDTTELSFDEALLEMQVFTFEDGLTEIIPLVSDTASIGIESSDNYQYCGTRTYTFVADPADPSQDEYLTYDSATRELTAISDDLIYFGEYTITVTVALDDYPSVELVETFVLDITSHPCWRTQFILPSQQHMDMLYSVMAESASYTMPSDVTDEKGCDNGGCSDYCGIRLLTIESVVINTANTPADTDYNEFFSEDGTNYVIETSNPLHVGEYTFSMHYQLEDYDIITVTEEWLVTVNPCEVTELSFATTPEFWYSYELGADTVIQGPDEIGMSFTDQTDTFSQGTYACGYTETVTLLSADHEIWDYDALTNEFTVSYSENKDLIGVHEILMQVSIQVPTDATQETDEEIVFEYTIELEVIDPCLTTELEFVYTPETTTVITFETTATNTYPVKDSASCHMISSDCYEFCGAREYTLRSRTEEDTYNNFVTYDTTGHTELRVESNNLDDAGDHIMWLDVVLVDYPDIETLTQRFVIKISPNDCWFTTFSIPEAAEPVIAVDPVTGEEYEVWVPDIWTEINVPAVVHTFDDVEDSASLANGDDGYDYCGARTYNIVDVQIINADFTDDIDTEVDEWWLDFITLNEADRTLTVQTPDTKFIGNFTVIVEVSLEDYPNAQYTENPLQDVPNVLAKQTSTEYQFVVEIEDPCWSSTLTATIIDKVFEWDVWQEQVMTGTVLVNHELGYDCGYTYTLDYYSGPLQFSTDPDPLSYVLTVDEDAGTIDLTGQAPNYDWVGRHTYRIKCENGNTDMAPRGEGGFFNLMYSNNFVVKIVDPCEASIVNQDDGVAAMPDIEIASNQPQNIMDWSIAGPTDSASALYGNGYDKCGKLNYSVVNQDYEDFDYQLIIYLKVREETNAADEFQLTVFNDPHGIEFEFTVNVKAELFYYETSTPAYFPVNIETKICRPYSFYVEPIANQEYNIGSGIIGEVEIQVPQGTCGYRLTFRAYWLDKLTQEEKDLPQFMTLELSDDTDFFSESLNNAKLTWVTNDFGDIEIYTVRIYAIIIYNGVEILDESTDFDLQVLPRRIEQGVDAYNSYYVEWDLVLEDVSVQVGEEKLIEVYIEENPFQQGQSVWIDYFTARNIVDWEEEYQLFHIQGQTELDLGDHEVCMEVRYEIFTKTEVKRDCFILTVTSDKVEEQTNPENEFEGVVVPDDRDAQDDSDASFIDPELSIDDLDAIVDEPEQLPLELDLLNALEQLEQWDSLIEEAIEEGKTPLDVQEGAMTQDGLASIEFDVPMVWPADIVDLINNQLEERRQLRNLKGFTPSLKNELQYIELSMIEPEQEETTQSSNLQSYRAHSVTPDFIRLEIDFEDPLRVSQTIVPDFLLVKLNLGDFKNVLGQTLPNGLIKSINLSRQVASREEADAIEHFSSLVIWMAAITALVYGILMVATGAPLTSLWAMITSLQIMSFVPLFESLKTPGNVSIFTKYLLKLSTLDLIPTQGMDRYLYSIPEQNAYNLNFEQCGIEYTSLVGNSGMSLWILYLAINLMILWLITVSLCTKFAGWLSKQLYFGFFIRFVSVFFVKLALIACLNYKTEESAEIFSAVKYSNALAFILLFLLVAFTLSIPIGLGILYCFGKWKSQSWMEKIGTIFDGYDYKSKSKSKCGLLIYMTFFYLRRFALVICLLCIHEQKWAALLTTSFFTWVMAGLRDSFKPYEDKNHARLETFNDTMLIGILCLMFGFSDFPDDPKARSEIGKGVIVMMMGTVVVRTAALLSGIMTRLKQIVKRLINTQKNGVALKQLVKRQELAESRFIEAKAKAAVLTIDHQEVVQNELDKLDDLPDSMSAGQAESIQNELDRIDELPSDDEEESGKGQYDSNMEISNQLLNVGIDIEEEEKEAPKEAADMDDIFYSGPNNKFSPYQTPREEKDELEDLYSERGQQQEERDELKKVPSKEQSLLEISDLDL